MSMCVDFTIDEMINNSLVLLAIDCRFVDANGLDVTARLIYNDEGDIVRRWVFKSSSLLEKVAVLTLDVLALITWARCNLQI